MIQEPKRARRREIDSAIRFVRVSSSRKEESLAHAVADGLSATQKSLPSRFFYDIAGSQLFERITSLPEYYLTRSETQILERFRDEIIDAAGRNLQIIEFGSGSSEKTRLLLRSAVERQRSLEYVPIDISSEFLEDSSRELIDDIPGLAITALAGDYLDSLAAIPPHADPRLFLFLGSTIGNFEPDEAIEFLSAVRETMRPQDRLLIGVDLKKPREIIEPAYNDSEGVTELFNKNILVRVNRELCGRFDLSLFEHEAPWIEEKSRVEMRLVSTRDQEVSVEGIEQSFSFRAGEYIHTENSHKWSAEVFQAMCGQAGLKVSRAWHDEKAWFALHLLERGAY